MAFSDIIVLASSQFQLAYDVILFIQLLSSPRGRLVCDLLEKILALSLSLGYFAGRPADYVFMLLFNSICIDVS